MPNNVIVSIPPPLREFTDGNSEVTAEGTTIGEIIEDLENHHSGIKDRICTEEGELREFLNIHINDEDVGQRDGLDTEVSPEDDISITPALSGGASPPHSAPS